MKRYFSVAPVLLSASLALPAQAAPAADLNTEQVFECEVIYDLLQDYGMEYRYGLQVTSRAYNYASPTPASKMRWSDDIDVAEQQIAKAYPDVESRKEKARACDRLFDINRQ